MEILGLLAVAFGGVLVVGAMIYVWTYYFSNDELSRKEYEILLSLTRLDALVKENKKLKKKLADKEDRFAQYLCWARRKMDYNEEKERRWITERTQQGTLMVQLEFRRNELIKALDDAQNHLQLARTELDRQRASAAMLIRGNTALENQYAQAQKALKEKETRFARYVKDSRTMGRAMRSAMDKVRERNYELYVANKNLRKRVEK